MLRDTGACTFWTSNHHRIVKKWSEPLMFLTFSLLNVLRTTTPYTFSTPQLPKVVRSWCELYILTWKCASRHNALFPHLNSQKRSERDNFSHFLLPNMLRATSACNFSFLIYPSLLLTLRSHKTLETHSVSRVSYLFAHLHLPSCNFLPI